MESIQETSKNTSGMNFLKTVFRFDEESKSDMSNIIQYSFLAIIPIVILNKLSQKYIPEANEEKGSFEILAEILIQVFSIFLGLLFIDRVIRTVPTYSGEEYPKYNMVFVILPTLMIILSLQTKLGEKISILVDRIGELWEGKAKKKHVKVSQPISSSSNMILTQAPPPQQMGTTDISQLPQSSGTGASSTVNYNDFFRKENTPMPGAASPGMEGFVPMAANEVMGGAFGSSFGQM